jgi:hypothetical protein
VLHQLSTRNLTVTVVYQYGDSGIILERDLQDLSFSFRWVKTAVAVFLGTGKRANGRERGNISFHALQLTSSDIRLWFSPLKQCLLIWAVLLHIRSLPLVSIPEFQRASFIHCQSKGKVVSVLSQLRTTP